jgi:hypothetical protein
MGVPKSGKIEQISEFSPELKTYPQLLATYPQVIGRWADPTSRHSPYIWGLLFARFMQNNLFCNLLGWMPSKGWTIKAKYQT